MAVQRLNGINSTIQQAVSSNDETQNVLRDMSVDYAQTSETISRLEELLDNTEVTTPHQLLLHQFTHLQNYSLLMLLVLCLHQITKSNS